MATRIMKEIKKACASEDYDFFMDDGKYNSLEINNCYLRWTVKAGCYAGQTHIIRFKFEYGSNEKKMYPMHPPNCMFLTPIWHTNISSGEGSICVDILKENTSDSQSWSPMYGVDTIFNSIVLLLEEHNEKSPYNSAASKDYQEAKTAGKLELFTTIAMHYYKMKLESFAKSNKADIVLKLLTAPEFEKPQKEKQ